MHQHLKRASVLDYFKEVFKWILNINTDHWIEKTSVHYLHCHVSRVWFYSKRNCYETSKRFILVFGFEGGKKIKTMLTMDLTEEKKVIENHSSPFMLDWFK